ncbi:MAG: hypothetical protein RR922_02660 [Clostridia bacterium]
MRLYTIKDAKYYDDLLEKLSKSSEYERFVKAYKGNGDVEQAYLASIAKNILEDVRGEIKTRDTTKSQDKRVLYSIGQYLKKSGNVEELVDQQNVQFDHNLIEKYTDKSPFKVDKQEINNEFSKASNEENTEAELCAKTLFWTNRATKALTQMCTSLAAKESEELNITNGKMIAFSSKIYNNLVIDNLVSDFTNIYKEYNEGNISEEEFKKNNIYKSVKINVNRLVKDNNEHEEEKIEKDIDMDFLATYSSIRQATGYLYMAKEYYIQKTIEKVQEENSLKDPNDMKILIGTKLTGNRKNDQEGQRILNVIIPGYNGPIQVHTEKDKIDVYKGDEPLEYEERLSSRNRLCADTVTLKKLTKENISELTSLRRQKSNLPTDVYKQVSLMQDVVKGFASWDILGIENRNREEVILSKEERDKNVLDLEQDVKPMVRRNYVRANSNRNNNNNNRNNNNKKEEVNETIEMTDLERLANHFKSNNEDTRYKGKDNKKVNRNARKVEQNKKKGKGDADYAR